jgi:pimeloyl-ACP methyl ester carboxylesterase
LLSVLLSSIAATAPTPGGIQWGPCPTEGVRGELYKNNVSAIECGSLAVPLDYTAPDSDAVHNISLVRAPAPKQPAKGAIQFNFGGPGGPAISTLVGTANIYQGLTGGEYDLIAFEPRGVSMELPFVCATTDQSALQVLQSIFDVSVSERDARRAWALAQQNIGLCQNLGNGNVTAEYIGTAFMARDMERVAQEVDKDGFIRFWGFSYGTTLGVTIASMFPEKIGGMILDGIQNAKE